MPVPRASVVEDDQTILQLAVLRDLVVPKLFGTGLRRAPEHSPDTGSIPVVVPGHG